MSAYETYQYQTDTIIGSYSYKKIKNVNSSSFALFREVAAQKKVYQYDLANSMDFLYIDFNLNYGDSFNLTIGGSVYSLTVCTKDSMLINGCYHNKVNLSNNGGFNSYNFVEGILSEINPLNPFRWPGDPQVYTTCECHNGQFYYDNLGSPFAPFSCNLSCTPPTPCSVINSQEDLESYLQFTIYPNPISSVVNIEDSQNELHTAKIDIKNILGESVHNSSFISQIDLAHLPPGVYFLTIRTGYKLNTIKFIKQ
jgi:hypothetical protein